MGVHTALPRATGLTAVNPPCKSAFGLVDLLKTYNLSQDTGGAPARLTVPGRARYRRQRADPPRPCTSRARRLNSSQTLRANPRLSPPGSEGFLMSGAKQARK